MIGSIIKATNPLGQWGKCLQLQADEEFNVTYSLPCKIGSQYVFSVYVKPQQDGSTVLFNDVQQTLTKNQWSRLIYKFTAVESDIILTFSAGTFYLCMAKLENGNFATDWSRAPQELATQEGLDVTNASINETKTELNSKITQTAESISTEVSKKVGSDEIISKINQTAETIQIAASKINLNGVVTANNNFQILTDGSVRINSADIVLTRDWITGDTTRTELSPEGFITTQFWGETFDLTGDLFKGVNIYRTSDPNGYGCKISSSKIAIANSIIMGKGSYMSKDTVCVSTDSGYSKMDDDGFYTNGTLYVSGEKNRVVDTYHYGQVLQNAFETPVPTFADYGEAVLDENGFCRIFFDDKFIETVDNTTVCNVQLTKYGSGDIWVQDRQPEWMDISGTPGLRFGWFAMFTQRDYNANRLREFHFAEKSDEDFEELDFEEIGADFLTDFENEFDYMGVLV